MGKTKITRIICMALAVLFLVSSAAFTVSADASSKTKTSQLTEKSIYDYIDTLNTISYEEYLTKNREAFAKAPYRTGDETEIRFDLADPDEAKWVYWTGGVDKSGKGKGNSARIGEDGEWVLTEYSSNREVTATKSAGDFSAEEYAKLAHVETYDGEESVYTPSTGSVTWILNLKDKEITEKGVYSISIVYYPVEGKAAAIEREFYINYAAPFSEARSITFQKRWDSPLQAEYRPAKKLRKNADTMRSALEDVMAQAVALGLTCELKWDESNFASSCLLITQPDEVTKARNEFFEKYDIRFFEVDDNNNELRPAMKQAPEWMIYTLRDSDGYYAEDSEQNGYYSEGFGFVLEPGADGTIALTLAGVNEAMAVKEVIFTPYTILNNYDNYIADLKAQLNVETLPEGSDVVKIEGEYTTNTSTNVVYPVEDRASALTSPCDTNRTLLNTIGTEKWETAGQWVEYQFSVDAAGMYEIYSRYKQSYLDGLYVSRSLQIFTNGYESRADYAAKHGGKTAGYYNGIPFEEAAELRYDYGTNWQVTALSRMGNKRKKKDPEKVTYELYFEEGVTYTIRLEVTLGSMSQNVRELESILEDLNQAYLDIIKLTGASPDSYRDYGFASLLPETLEDMIDSGERLEALSAELKKNTASTYTGICDKLANLLSNMGHGEARGENVIAKNLSNFKSYVGSLGTFLTDAKTQPLQLDYLVIQGASKKAPKANSNFFRSFAHEISGFIASFFRDYNNMGARADASETNESVNVWLAYGRDQAQVIRNLATNDFTTETGIAVDLKLVSGGTLLPSILAGKGPDVYLGLDQASVINYAIRGALMNIDDMDGYQEISKNFNEAAMVVLQMDDENGEKHCYGLPENQQFPMMFVRIDILADLEIEIPKTWAEIYEVQTKLKHNNMDIGVTTNYQILLYQQGGELFADNGMRINLDSYLGLKAFNEMCNMFTQYSFPYSYNAANRFRTGEMPIIISDYTALYNHLKVFATELDGTWSFVPLPGYEREDGTINNCSVSSVTAAVLIKGKKEIVRDHYATEEEYKKALEDAYGVAWKFMKWYTDAPCQTQYATEMVAIIGDSAKHSTANYAALKEMPWTESEREEVEKQFSNLASIPNYPGYYYIGRYTSFAFLAAYNSAADPSSEILGYINTINKEITRKREEFNLETLEIGQKLSEKRSGQAEKALDILAKEYGANDANSPYKKAYDLARQAIANGEKEKTYPLAIGQAEEAAIAFGGLIDPNNGSVNVQELITARVNGTDQERRDALKELKAQSWFIYVSKQTPSSKNPGYEISSLNEQQLLCFIAECLSDFTNALRSY